MILYFIVQHEVLSRLVNSCSLTQSHSCAPSLVQALLFCYEAACAAWVARAKDRRQKCPKRNTGKYWGPKKSLIKENWFSYHTAKSGIGKSVISEQRPPVCQIVRTFHCRTLRAKSCLPLKWLSHVSSEGKKEGTRGQLEADSMESFQRSQFGSAVINWKKGLIPLAFNSSKKKPCHQRTYSSQNTFSYLLMHTYLNWKKNKRSEHQAWTSLQILQGDPYMQQDNIFIFHCLHFIVLHCNLTGQVSMSIIKPFISEFIPNFSTAYFSFV